MILEELEIEVSANAVLTKVKEHKERFAKSYKLLLKAFEKKAKVYEAKYHEFTVKVNVKGKEPVPPPKPEDRTKDYDLYIDMLEQHINDSEDKVGACVTLSETLWKRLWLDKWDWTYRHHESLMFYARAGGAGASEIEEIASAYNA